MLKRALRAVIVLASSAVVIPYAVALIANVLCGWPIQRDRYRRALNPRKVYALNYALLLELTKVRFLGLCYRWQRFYAFASRDTVIKNIPFGSNNNFLDVYLSKQDTRTTDTKLKPVIVFIYGGTWGSGDKSMYGLLCSNLAEKLKSVVICPNYSIFPKGFVDDMVQDLGEVLQWVKSHIDSFGGNKKEIILIGHSAGAHLAALTVMELCIKQLVCNENSLVLSAEEIAKATAKGDNLELSFVGLSSTYSNIQFDEEHFNGNEGSGRYGDERRTDLQSKVETSLMGHGQGVGGTVMESFYFVDKPDENGEGTVDSLVMEEVEPEKDSEMGPEDSETGEEVGQSANREELDETSSKATEVASDKSLALAEAREKTEKLKEDKTTEDETDLLSSIKLVIGLAGVYNIAEHFEFEAERGVEDVSTMARAMYGPKHFPQFSPTLLAKGLPMNTRLPPLHLLHGDADYVVPFSSSVCFGEALWNRGMRSVEVVILPGCNHYDICLDLMETGRQWYNVLLAEIQRSINVACI